jgi:hypothetical protein
MSDRLVMSHVCLYDFHEISVELIDFMLIIYANYEYDEICEIKLSICLNSCLMI